MHSIIDENLIELRKTRQNEAKHSKKTIDTVWAMKETGRERYQYSANSSAVGLEFGKRGEGTQE